MWGQKSPIWGNLRVKMNFLLSTHNLLCRKLQLLALPPNFCNRRCRWLQWHWNRCGWLTWRKAGRYRCSETLRRSSAKDAAGLAMTYTRAYDLPLQPSVRRMASRALDRNRITVQSSVQPAPNELGGKLAAKAYNYTPLFLFHTSVFSLGLENWSEKRVDWKWRTWNWRTRYISFENRLHYNAVCNSFQNNGRIQVTAARKLYRPPAIVE